jgi:hypothetical protein
MKATTVRTISFSAGLLALAFGLGTYWGTNASVALNGLRSVGPFTHAEEAAFIRSRVSLPIIQPEWVSGVELNEMTWIKYEMLARCGLSLVFSVVTICVVRLKFSRKNETGA